MGVYEGRGQLSKALRDLLRQWAEACAAWQDANTAQFEKEFLLPLEQDVKNALAAMDHMAVLLNQIRQECR